jgi:hypothetical protein
VHRSAWQALARRVGHALATPRLPRAWWWSVRETFADPHNQAFLLGLRDYGLRRFGNCPDRVRRLSAAWSKRTRPAPAATAALHPHC